MSYTPAVAPAGAALYATDLIPQWRGSLLFATLRGIHLHRLMFAQDDPARMVTQERLYDGQFSRSCVR